MSNKKNLKLIPSGETFKIGGVEFIKVDDDGLHTTILSKDCLFQMRFGRTNDFYLSDIRNSLQTSILPVIKHFFGSENVHFIDTELCGIDGTRAYTDFTSFITIPSLSFLKENIDLFKKYPASSRFWLCTPDRDQHRHGKNFAVISDEYGQDWICNCDTILGVRPMLSISSFVLVETEERKNDK